MEGVDLVRRNGCGTDSPMIELLAFGMPGGPEWIILLVLGLLIFGRRLPEVGRSLGRGIVEFKKGIRGLEDEIEDASSTPSVEQKPRPSIEQTPAESVETPTATEATPRVES
jgi:sec-independent protein translocase protein TatA